eukprot:2733614-Prymnesium_polylepis.3
MVIAPAEWFTNVQALRINVPPRTSSAPQLASLRTPSKVTSSRISSPDTSKSPQQWRPPTPTFAPGVRRCSCRRPPVEDAMSPGDDNPVKLELVTCSHEAPSTTANPSMATLRSPNRMPPRSIRTGSDKLAPASGTMRVPSAPTSVTSLALQCAASNASMLLVTWYSLEESRISTG